MTTLPVPEAETPVWKRARRFLTWWVQRFTLARWNTGLYLSLMTLLLALVLFAVTCGIGLSASIGAKVWRILIGVAAGAYLLDAVLATTGSVFVTRKELDPYLRSVVLTLLGFFNVTLAFAIAYALSPPTLRNMHGDFLTLI